MSTTFSPGDEFDFNGLDGQEIGTEKAPMPITRIKVLWLRTDGNLVLDFTTWYGVITEQIDYSTAVRFFEEGIWTPMDPSRSLRPE